MNPAPNNQPANLDPVFGERQRTPRVKICGITRAQDALAAERAGAHAVGFVFVPRTKRHVTIQEAASISRQLGPALTRVGVFVNAPEHEILRAVREAHLTAVQLHGNEPPELAASLMKSVRVIRALPFRAAPTPAHYPQPAHAVLLDAQLPGSGVPFPWNEAAPWRSHPRLILAGGLTPTNVARAVRALNPYAVDVSSGVEEPRLPNTSGRAVKSAALIAHFVEAARGDHQ